MILTDAQMLDQIDAFLSRSGMAPTRFGREAMGEASLVDSLRKGRSLSLKNANRVIAFIREQDAIRSSEGGEPSPDNACETIEPSTERAAA